MKKLTVIIIVTLCNACAPQAHSIPKPQAFAQIDANGVDHDDETSIPRDGCNATDDSECTDAEWAKANDPNDCSRGIDESNQEACSQ